MRYICFFLSFFPSVVFSQDFSGQWQDLFSYINVKDFTIVENELVAITENAMFITDLNDLTSEKFSSVNGLSGLVTSTVGFDKETQSTLIGYENGLVEVVTNDKRVVAMPGAVVNQVLVTKEVKGFFLSNDYKYVFGDFGILELNIEDFEFGDWFQLTDSSLPTVVNSLIVSNDIAYAATEQGVYSIDLNLGTSPITFSNWSIVVNEPVSALLEINNEVYFSKGANVYSVTNTVTPVIVGVDNILGFTLSQDNIVLTTTGEVSVYGVEDFSKKQSVSFNDAVSHSFSSNKSILVDGELYLSTDSYGVLSAPLSDNSGNYTEIHPDGPSRNDVFSISTSDGVMLLTYGGFDSRYNRRVQTRGISIFNSGKWINLDNQDVGGKRDYTKAIIDPENTNRIFISSYDQGVVELNYDRDNDKVEYVGLWNDDNTGLVIPHLIAGFTTLNWEANMIVDKNNHIWVANARAHENRIFSKFDSSQNGGEWVDYADFETFKGNNGVTRGINKLFVNHENYVFAGGASVGVLVFDANDASEERKTGVIDSFSDSGGLVSDEVFSVVADDNDRVWIGTSGGLMVFNDYGNLFNESKSSASRLIIEENGEAKEFLADIQINDILIDDAENKWFGTNGSGLFHTSSDAQTTFEIFNVGNSPLPSDVILDLELDETTGIIHIVTEKGVVSYNPENEPFGSSVTEVVAYPNPSIRNIAGHEQITLVAKNGEGIPEGTNVKIIDVSGKLVYETNVGSDSGAIGGKVVWDKRNLNGSYVVSGVYIVLLSSPDATETTTTKIAIVN